MSNSHRSFGYGDEMMQHMFDMDAGYKPTSSATMQRKNKMKRMEELSHSLDDGLNNLSDDYDRERSGGVKNRGRAARPQQYDDEIDDDDDGETEDRYIDDYYYSGTTKSYDQRPRSYNEKYASYNMHDDYDSRGENYNRNRYSLNESLMSKGRHQQSPLAQQRQMQPTLRRPPTAGPSSSGTAQANSKHILFNDEDDVRYVNEKKQMNKSASYSFSPTPKHKKEPSSPTSLFSKKKPSKEDLAKIEKPGQQVMKAKLKIQNLSNDDTILHMKNSKQSQLTRFHSLEAKLPSHGSERNAMSPTILEEIEFEMQDVDNEKEFEKEHGKEILEKEKEKPSKDKSGKDKKRDNSASAPTAKKSLKAHLSNHKKLFKVPDIDLNNLKFSCFFSSNKNITALNSSKQKKEEPISKSVDALNDSPKSSQTSKSPPSSPSHKTKVETKFEKHEKINKVDKFEERQERCVTNRTKSNRTMGSGSTIQSSSEGFKDDENSGNSLSDIDFEVIKMLSNRRNI